MPQAGRIPWQVRCVWVLRAHPSAPREAVPVPSPRGRTKPLAPTAPHCHGFVSSSLVLAPVVKIDLQHHARERAANGLCSLLQPREALAQKSLESSILRLGHDLPNIPGFVYLSVSPNKRRHFRAG